VEPELDIVVWSMRAQRASEISQRNRGLFDRAAKSGLHLALLELPATLLSAHWPGVNFDRDHVTCLRSCLMKPEHLDWSDRIWRILDEAGGPQPQ